MSDSVSVPFVRSPYNYDRDLVSDETGLFCAEPTLAQQNFREETDINYIVDTFTRTGTLPNQPLPAQFGDFTGVHDFHSALNSVHAARDAFMTLPAAVRTRFANDPGQLIDFISRPDNYDEAVKLGLVDSSPLVAPVASTAKGGTKGGVSKKPAVSSSNEDGDGGSGDE